MTKSTKPKRAIAFALVCFTLFSLLSGLLPSTFAADPPGTEPTTDIIETVPDETISATTAPDEPVEEVIPEPEEPETSNERQTVTVSTDSGEITLTATPSGSDEIQMEVNEVIPTDEDVMYILETFGIQNVLSYYMVDINVSGFSGNADLNFAFDTESPRLSTVNLEYVFFQYGGKTYIVPSVDTDVTESESTYQFRKKLESKGKAVSNIETTISDDMTTFRFIVFTEDMPNTVARISNGSPVYVGEFRWNGTHIAIGGYTAPHYDSDNGRTALCIRSWRKLAAGEYNTETTYANGPDPYHDGQWDDISTSTQHLLISLAYYVDKYQRQGYDKSSTGASAQMLAWGLINEDDPNAYTANCPDIVWDLCSDMYSNPDGIDLDASTVTLYYPDTQNRQELIQIRTAVFPTPKGNVAAQKAVSGTTSNSSSLSNWKIRLYSSYSNAQNDTNWIGEKYTASDGTVRWNDLEYVGRTLYIREAPASAQDRRSDASTWLLDREIKSVTVYKDTTAWASSNITNIYGGKLQVTKNTTSGGTRDGWVFELYGSQADAQNRSNRIATATTTGGVATFEGLTDNKTYYIREAASQSGRTNWIFDDRILSGTAKAGQTLSVGSVTNTAPGNASIGKRTATGQYLNKWRFEIYDSEAKANSGSGYFAAAYTNASGVAQFNTLVAGRTYYIREAPLSRQDQRFAGMRADWKNAWQLDSKVYPVTIQTNATVSASTDTNYPYNIDPGAIRVRKDVVGAVGVQNPRSGWIFNVYSDEACTNKVTTITTGNDGYGTSINLPGNHTYWVREAPMNEQTRSDKLMWALSETVWNVTIRPGYIKDAFTADSPTAKNFYGKYVYLHKTTRASCVDELNGNHMYSLAGAEYDVYKNTPTGAVKVETIITGPDGRAKTTTLFKIGESGYLVETKAPPGYLLDTNHYTFEVEPVEGDLIITVEEIPTFDPAWQRFRKVDPETGHPQGDMTFERAVFRWDYYDNTNWSGNPVRTWFFKTDANGTYTYDPNWLDTSKTNSPLFTNAANNYRCALGSVKITEVETPTGYNAMPVLYATITQQGNGLDGRWLWTKESLDHLKYDNNGNTDGTEIPKDYANIQIQKLDKDFGANTAGDLNNFGTAAPQWASFVGCEFSIYNRSDKSVKVGDFPEAAPGEICYVITIENDNGFAETATKYPDGLFPVGRYEIRETKGNDFYQCNTEWSQTFQITGTETQPITFSFDCKNTMIPGELVIDKVDPQNHPLAGAKFRLEWRKNELDTWKPVTKADDIVMGGCSSPDLTDDGCLVSDGTNPIRFSGLYPVLYYRLVEVESPYGYQLLKDDAYVGTLGLNEAKDAYIYELTVVNAVAFELSDTGSNSLLYWTAISMATATACGFVLTVILKKKRTLG